MDGHIGVSDSCIDLCRPHRKEAQEGLFVVFPGEEKRLSHGFFSGASVERGGRMFSIEGGLVA